MRKKYKYNKQKTFGYDANGKRIIKWFHADSLRDMEKQIQQYALQLQFAPNASNIRFKDYAEHTRETAQRLPRICTFTLSNTRKRLTIIR